MLCNIGENHKSIDLPDVSKGIWRHRNGISVWHRYTAPAFSIPTLACSLSSSGAPTITLEKEKKYLFAVYKEMTWPKQCCKYVLVKFVLHPGPWSWSISGDVWLFFSTSPFFANSQNCFTVLFLCFPFPSSSKNKMYPRKNVAGNGVNIVDN